MAYQRGVNPVWLFDDLQGNILDDTYYFFVLQNELPYLPASVYHTPSGTPWTNPIRFLANGTLPVDIFFNPGTLDSPIYYRLEIRQGATQGDPLIYLIENYLPNSGGGGGDITNVQLVSDNQITNPQFATINFNGTLSVSGTNPAVVSIGPGWDLVLTGTGTASITRVPLTSDPTTINPTNAPYALRLVLTAWSTVKLRQRFQQNGMLWARKYASSSVTARIEGSPQNISATLVASNGSTLATVLSPVQVGSSFEEYNGNGHLGATTNGQIPPVAYIDYILTLPSNVDIYLSSLQVVVEDLGLDIAYQQDTIDRQIDHTFHNYRDSIIVLPKSTVLTGWDFSLNPWQFTASTLANLDPGVQARYDADQTIIRPQTTNSLQTGKASAISLRQGYMVKARAGITPNKFALIQYVDSKTIRPYWDYVMSSLVRARIFSTHSTSLGIKMRLIYRATLPPTPSTVDPITSMAGIDPTFAAGWTAIAPRNDPTYILLNVYAPGEGLRPFPAYPFEHFVMPAEAAGAETLGIVLYSTGNLNATAGTEDYVVFDAISLTPSEFAVDSNAITFDECLRQCQFYYEKSYLTDTMPGTNTQANSVMSPMNIFPAVQATGVSTRSGHAKTFGLSFKQVKRSNSPLVTFYSLLGVTNQVTGVIYNAGVAITAVPVDASGHWNQTALGNSGVVLDAFNVGAFVVDGALSTNDNPDSFIQYQYTVDARLGLVGA